MTERITESGILLADDPDRGHPIGIMTTTTGQTVNFIAPDAEAVAVMAEDVENAQRAGTGLLFRDPVHGDTHHMTAEGVKAVALVSQGYATLIDPEASSNAPRLLPASPADMVHLNRAQRRPR